MEEAVESAFGSIDVPVADAASTERRPVLGLAAERSNEGIGAHL